MQEYNSPWVLRQLLNEYVDGTAQPIPGTRAAAAGVDEPQEVWDAQDAALQAQHQRKGIVDVTALPATAHEPRMILWQGDITRLNADAIVNAANSQMLRCFVP